jgi:hypothetical protein
MILEWKDIEGYEGIYKISNKGDVLSLERTAPHTSKSGKVTFRKVNQIIKKPFLAKNGYYVIELRTNKIKKFLVHRLVAKHFIPNPDNKPEVNHINLDTKCNETWNLEWVTKKENGEHALINQRKLFKGNQYKTLKNKKL